MADVTARPGAAFEHPFGWGVTGLAGTLGVRILDNDGATTTARTTAWITELVAGSGEYVVNGTAPSDAGEYTAFVDDGATTPGHVYTFSILVTTSSPGPVTPNDRDLCALADVKRYAPGYDSLTDPNADALDDILLSLIAAESQDWHDETGREFVAIASGSSTRTFDLGRIACRRRRLWIGDATTVTAVVVVDQGGDTIDTVASTDYVTMPRVREAHEPITSLWFPSASDDPAELGAHYTVQVTATWGFPSVPANVREAVAGMVIVRYVQAVASGDLPATAFSDAVTGVSVGGLLAAARRTMNRWTRPAVA